MRAVVLGATGRMGVPLVEALERRGYDVIRASRATGVNALTDEGLESTFAGAEVIVDALNIDTTSKKHAVAFFQQTARNVAAAAKATKPRHLILVSIWNATHPEAQGYGYYAGKTAQEKVYHSSGLPVTIVRSVQWYELAEMLLDGVHLGPFAVVPHMLSRPCSAAAAADAIADVALGAPKPAGVIVAGPETHDIADLAKQIAAKRGGRPRVMTAPVPGMEAFGKGLLLPPADVPGVGPTFAEWLRTRG